MAVSVPATLLASTSQPNSVSRSVRSGRRAIPARLAAEPTAPITNQALALSVVSTSGDQTTFQVLGRIAMPPRTAIAATLAPAWLSSQASVTEA
jgi:hypothetical protein